MLLGACKTNKVQQETAKNFTAVNVPGPRALVYKTKANYANLVPVILSKDKTSIISYPDPSDIRAAIESLRPTQLANGYLLDNKGINEDVAFLNITYEEYAALKQNPGAEVLMSKIKDKDPLIALCDCGNKKAINDITTKMNALIEQNVLNTKCKNLIK